MTTENNITYPYNSINIHNKESLLKETISILNSLNLEINIKIIVKTINDIEDIFKGNYKGYRACNVKYHDLNHTFDAFLAMLRIVHGALLSGINFSSKEIVIGLLAALFHDTGYIQKTSENAGTGAKFTLIHITRSHEFLIHYFKEKGMKLSKVEEAYYKNILDCTGFSTTIDKIDFCDKNNEVLGKMLGTADLIGQMADRYYLEKLLLLYEEFSEAGVGNYQDELDLLKKTIGFFDLTQKRMETELDNMKNLPKLHFSKRWGFNQNLYEVKIEENKKYLQTVLEEHEDNYKRYLRRENL